MSYDRDRRDGEVVEERLPRQRPPLAPGKRTLTSSLAEVMRQADDGPAPSVTPELRTALAGETGTPLADAGRYSAEIGADVSHARVITGPAASAAASSIDARAFTVGERVFFGDGGFRPGTAEGDHIIRHELTHVAQQAGAAMPPVDQLQFTSPGSAAEEEAHQVAAGAGAGIASRPAQVARFDYEKWQNQDVGGNQYARVNAKDLYYAFKHKLAELPLASPSPFLKWSQGSPTFMEAFVRQMLTLGRDEYDEWVEVARKVVMPQDFRALLNSGRVILKERNDSKTGETVDVGPMRFTDSAAMPLVSATLRRLTESIGRVAPRYLAARLAADDGGAVLDPNAMVASHPCDYVLLLTLFNRNDVVELDLAGYRAAASKPDAPKVEYELASDPKALEWRFIDDEKAPNWIEVTSPKGATAELVAAHFWGSTQEATRLAASPPRFGLPMDAAEELRAKKGLSTGNWGTFGAHFAPWVPGNRELIENERDPAFGLLRSGASEEAALAEAGGEQAGAGASRGTLLQILERTRHALEACAQVATSFNLGGRLSEPIAYIDGRLDHFATAPEDEVGRWYVQAEKQDDVVGRAAMGLDAIQRHLENMGVADPSQMGKVPKAVRIPLDRVAQEFVDAAVLSRLVATADERVAKAELDLELAPVDTMELLLKDIQLRIAILRKADRKHHPSGEKWDIWKTDQPEGVVTYNNGDASGRELMLRNQLVDLRAMILAHDPAAGPKMQELYKQIDQLGAETEIATGHTMMSIVMENYMDVLKDGWKWAGEFVTGDATRPVDYMFEASKYKQVFGVAWSLYILGDPDSHERARRYIVDQLGNDKGFASFLQRAYDVIDSIETKAMILKIATIIGIVIVTMGVGSLFEGIAAGMGAGEIGAFIVGASAEAISFTAIDAAVFGTDGVAGTLAVEFGTNLATFGLLRAWRMRKAAKVADDAMAAAKLDNATRLEQLRGYVLKGKELTGEGLLIAATAYAQMQVDSLRQRGQFVSLSEIREQGKQGLAMVLGIAIGGRVFREQLDQLRKMGSAVGEDLARRIETLRDLSRTVEHTKSPELALELVRQDRALLETELSAHGRALDPRFTHYPPPPEVVVGQHIKQMTATELTLGLDEVVPGRVYMGTPEQLGPILKHLEESGAKVTPHEEGGRRSFEVQDGDRHYKIHESTHYSTRTGGEVVPANTRQTFEANSVVGHVDSVKQGRDLMRRLVAGDRTALADLGYDGFPPGIETSRVEWGLARRWDGKLAVVLGGFRDIDWSKLPHMKPLSHTHPFNESAALRGKDGDGLVRIDELGDLSSDLTHLFPSAADFSVMARGNIKDHVVHTPFVDRGHGRIGNPGPNETGARVDFVIEKSTYVGRWEVAEDVGVYRAQVTARTPEGAIWRGEIYAVDAGGSMLYKTRPPISSKRLPPPKPRFETKAAQTNAVLIHKLKGAGVPDPAVNADVATVLGAMDAGTEKWMDELLDLQAKGQVTGIKEWWDGLLVNPSGDRVGNMLIEIREARRLVDERPGEVIDLGSDAKAPMKPGKPTEIDAAFDFEASRGGAVTGSVEIKAAGLLHRARDLESTLDSSIAKIKQRAGHGQPIPGPHEVRFDVSFPGKGKVPGSGGKTIQHDGNGVRTYYDPRGIEIPSKPGNPNPVDIRDEVTAYLNDKTGAQALDTVVLTDANGVIARYKNNGGTWVKL